MALLRMATVNKKGLCYYLQFLRQRQKSVLKPALKQENLCEKSDYPTNIQRDQRNQFYFDCNDYSCDLEKSSGAKVKDDFDCTKD